MSPANTVTLRWVGAPSVRIAFRIHDAVVGFADRYLSRTRNLTASSQTSGWVFYGADLGPTVAPELLFFWVFQNFGTFRSRIVLIASSTWKTTGGSLGIQSDPIGIGLRHPHLPSKNIYKFKNPQRHGRGSYNTCARFQGLPAKNSVDIRTWVLQKCKKIGIAAWLLSFSGK